MKKVIIFVLSLFCLVFPGTAIAADTEHIQSFQTNIAIRQDGVINITERIEYFFDSPRHGIIRNLPVVKTNDTGKKYEMSVSDISIADDTGESYPFTRTREGSTEVLKIGDANMTVTGTHWYVISYTVSGALTYFPGHDELYWNAVGTSWPVPVTSAVTTVTLPSPVALANLNASCFTGIHGSSAADCTITKTDTSVSVRVSRPLDAYEGATVVVGFPKGMVAHLEPKEVVPFFTTPAGKITLVLIGIAAFLWYLVAPFLVIRKWWTKGRDPKPAMGEVSAWFSPPRTKNLRDLTPAETGTLIDEMANLRDIYSTIVDLARRGYMKIIETRKNTFDFEKQKNWDNDKTLQPFELVLLRAIFEKGDRVKLKDLDLHDTFETVKKQLYDSMVTDGFFPVNPQNIRTKYYILAGFALITGNILLCIVAAVFGTLMPRKTLFGAEAAAVAKSLKNFLVSQDRQLKFQADRQMMFEKLLPYAIAFGVEKIWAARFKDIALKQPDWYVSSTGAQFNAVLFANSIGRAASVSFASSIASHSSSGFSSGFGGGGFSGGGGGGGGGGSW